MPKTCHALDHFGRLSGQKGLADFKSPRMVSYTAITAVKSLLWPLVHLARLPFRWTRPSKVLTVVIVLTLSLHSGYGYAHVALYLKHTAVGAAAAMAAYKTRSY